MNPLKSSFRFPEPTRSPEGLGGWGSTQVQNVDPVAVIAAIPVNGVSGVAAVQQFSPQPV